MEEGEKWAKPIVCGCVWGGGGGGGGEVAEQLIDQISI